MEEIPAEDAGGVGTLATSEEAGDSGAGGAPQLSAEEPLEVVDIEDEDADEQVAGQEEELQADRIGGATGKLAAQEDLTGQGTNTAD